MPLKHTHKRTRRPDFVIGDGADRDLQLEEFETGCTVCLVPTFASVMAAMGSGLAVVGVLAAAASLALLESRGASDPFFVTLAATTAAAAARFAWLHMSRETLHVENDHLEHRRTLLGIGPCHRYAAGGIRNLRLDRPPGGVVRFESDGCETRIGFGLSAEVARCLLETLQAQLIRMEHPPLHG